MQIREGKRYTTRGWGGSIGPMKPYVGLDGYAWVSAENPELIYQNDGRRWPGQDDPYDLVEVVSDTMNGSSSE